MSVNVRIKNPAAPSRTTTVKLLVDTGSRYTWIRTQVLHDIGIEPEETASFRTIDGRLLDRQIAVAVLELDGRRTGTTVVFAKEEDGEVLGVHALEGLRFEVNPYTGELHPAPAVLAV